MASTRLEILKSMVEQNPTDSFARYGLAMEYRNTGDLEAAMGEFRALMASQPDYAPAYFHGGQTLERMGRSKRRARCICRASKSPHAAATSTPEAKCRARGSCSS